MEPSSMPNNEGLVCPHTAVHEDRVLDVFYDRERNLFVFVIPKEGEEMDSDAPWMLDEEWGPYKRVSCPSGCEIGRWYRWLPSSLRFKRFERAFENVICYKISRDFNFWESFRARPFPEPGNGFDYWRREGFLKGLGVERAFEAMLSCHGSAQLSEFVDIVRACGEWSNLSQRLILVHSILFNADHSTLISEQEVANLAERLLDDITDCIGHVDKLAVLKPATTAFRFLMYDSTGDSAGDLLERIEPIADNAFWNSCAIMYGTFQERLEFLQEHLVGEWQPDSWNTLRGCVLSTAELQQYIALMKSRNLKLPTRLRCVYAILSHCFELNIEFDDCVDKLAQAGILDGISLAANRVGEHMDEITILDLLMSASWIAACRRDDIATLQNVFAELRAICSVRRNEQVNIAVCNCIAAAAVLGVREPKWRHELLKECIRLLEDSKIIRVVVPERSRSRRIDLRRDVNASLEILAIIFVARLVGRDRGDIEIICGRGKLSRGHRQSASSSSHAPPMQNAIGELLKKDPNPRNRGMFLAPGDISDRISDERLWEVIERVLQYRQLLQEDKKRGFEDPDFLE